MEIELKEIRDFIVGIPPFDRLPIELVEQLTQQVTIRYIRRGQSLPPDNVQQDRLYLLRKGAVSLISKEGNLLGKLGEGDICTVFCMEKTSQEKFHIQVDEDTLVYTIPCDKLASIVKDHPSVLSFTQKTASQRLNQTILERQEEASLTSTLMNTFVADILHAPVETIETHFSIRDAARKMDDASVSSLIVIKDAHPVGILTAKDISKRCVAADLPSSTAVENIMTSDMASVPSDMTVFDAQIIMTRKHLYHLPVIDENELTGIVSISDLMRQGGRNSVYLASAIRKADSIDELIEHSQMIPQLQQQLVKMGAAAEHVGKGVTAVTSAITRRLIEMAEKKLGPPPVAYAWIAAGSHARREQTTHSDQDNALIIADELRKKDEDWFDALSRFVCHGLAACGYIYCPGEVMAMNPRWRQTQSVWLGYFRQWINAPSPRALMYSSIFFDLRTIHGDESLLKRVSKDILRLTPKSALFLAHLTVNALKLRPPLGFFRDFVLVHDGKHNDTLDLKHSGITSIVDLARIYALAEGIPAVNTIERLKLAAVSSSLSRDGAANLLDAFEFIGTLRIQHQARQIAAGQTADNFMSPKEISKLEREHLKDAFKVIQTMQSSMEMRYRIG
jgi:CBS domain-containing protein